MSNKFDDHSSGGNGFKEAVRYVVRQSPMSFSIAFAAMVVMYSAAKFAANFYPPYQ